MIESALWADQLTTKWFETVTAIVAVLPVVVRRPFLFGNLRVLYLTR